MPCSSSSQESPPILAPVSEQKFLIEALLLKCPAYAQKSVRLFKPVTLVHLQQHLAIT